MVALVISVSTHRAIGVTGPAAMVALVISVILVMFESARIWVRFGAQWMLDSALSGCFWIRIGRTWSQKKATRTRPALAADQ
jgi:hypothetical protein